MSDQLVEQIFKIKQEHLKIVNKTEVLISRIDKNYIPKGENELRLFVIVRNESLRLPFFLEFYFKSGVDRVFLIDNNSTDSSREIASQYKNVHIFKIDESYRYHWYWMEYFLNNYGKNRWCLAVDADELFYFPLSENLMLMNLVQYLDNKCYTAMRSVLLDIYSKKPIVETIYKPNADPLRTCSYFDPEFTTQTDHFFDKTKGCYFNSISYIGGVRTRVFKQDNKEWFYNLTKFSLFKFTEETYLVQGMHGINGAKIADIEGTVIHTKFMSDFISRVPDEVKREEHFNNAMEYKFYNSKIQKNKKVTFYNKGSVRYRNTRQLIDLGIMKISKDYQKFVNSLKI